MSQGSGARAMALGALIVLALVLLPAWTSRADTLNLAFLVFLYVTLAQSWNVLAGLAGQINLGHAAFFGIGAFMTRQVWLAGWPPAVGLLAAGAVALVFGLIIGIPAFRLRGAYFAIGTLALAEILRLTISNVFPEVSTLPERFIGSYALVSRYYLALGLAVLMLLSLWTLRRSRIGLGLLALREDEDAAEASGVDTLAHKLIALGISTTFAGLAGGLFAFYHVSYYPQLPFSPAWTFDALLITFVGGVGTFIGPVVGAIFYVLVKEVLARSLVELHLLIFGILFILVVIALPGGLVEALARFRPRPAPGSAGVSAVEHADSLVGRGH